MKFSVKIPFSDLEFTNAERRHKDYFKSLFFSTKKDTTSPKYKVKVNFAKIEINGETQYLEEDTAASDGKLYIFDTQGNKLELDLNLLRKESISLNVEPDFDLYYLYNYIIEPLLIIWAAKHKVLYVHASAIWRKEGVYVFAAWRHAGKTSSIFSLADQEIKFMGDDFCVLSNSKVYLYPKYINIFSYNFQSYPWLYKSLPFISAIRIRLSTLLKRALYYTSQIISGSLSKVFYRLSELAEVSTNIKVTPAELGMETKVAGKLHKFIFITKGRGKKGKLVKLDRDEMAQKLLAITTYEIKDFLDILQKYKYLYPGKSNSIIENFEKNYLATVDKNIDEAYETFIKPTPSKDAYIEDLFLSK